MVALGGRCFTWLVVVVLVVVQVGNLHIVAWGGVVGIGDVAIGVVLVVPAV